MTITVNDIQLKRGTKSSVAAASLIKGEVAVTLDTNELYVGDGTGSKLKITDVFFYNTYSDFPSTGQVSKIYISKATGAIYIWDSTSSQYIKYDDTSNLLTVPPIGQLRKTTDFELDQLYQNVIFDTVDLETDMDIIEFDVINNDRFLIKEDGYYEITYNVLMNPQNIPAYRTHLDAQVVKNNVTVLNGSHIQIYMYEYEKHEMDNTFISYLVSGDFISLQTKKETTDTVFCRSDCSFNIKKISGLKGEKGDPGTPGVSYLSVQEENTTVASNITALNFVGLPVSVQDDGGGKASVTIDQSSITRVPLSVLQVRRTTDYINIPTNWIDFVFDSTDLENDIDSIQHNDTNPDRINIKTNGLYQITYSLDINDEVETRVIKNDSSILSGSTRDYGNHTDTTSTEGIVSNVFLAELFAGDYITFQAKANTTSEIIQANALMTVVKLDGVKGDQGPAGTQTKFCQVYDSVGGLDINLTTPVAVNFNQTSFIDTDSFQHVSNRVEVLKTGVYKVSYIICYTGDNGRKNVRTRVRKNGTFDLIGSYVYSYTRNHSNNYGSNSTTFIAQLTQNDYIQVLGDRVGDNGSANLIANECVLLVELLRET